MPRRTSRRNYNRISANQDDNITSSDVVSTESNALDEPLSPSSSFADNDGGGDDVGSSVQLQNNGNNDPPGGGGVQLSIATTSSTTTTTSSSLLPPIYHEINVIVMDAAQSKFNIQCDKQWKVSEFKEMSALVTKVPPQMQRLIHMGKLLGDGSTLEECGICESDKIIHLFPKPNVVITNNTNNGEDGGEGNADNNEGGGGGVSDGGGGGAHVPQIILDPEEASRRSQILILSSQEIFEAQHRVKIFSFLLMIICSMELLTLVTLFVGMQADDNNPYGGGGGGSGGLPPGNPTDAPPSTNGSSTMEMRTWQNSDYVDTILSAFGFYVSLLGIKATTENTLQLAKRYFFCLVTAGIGFNCYYFYTSVQAEEKNAQERNKSIGGSQLYTTAFVPILLPLLVWLLCIIRAYQFQHLIREAEVEAEERTRGLNGEGGGGATSGSNDDGGRDEGGEAPNRSLPYGSDDLELAVERGVSS